MLAIFNKGQFVNFWGNKITDNFLKITCEKMGWTPSEVAMFDFSSVADRIFSMEMQGDIKKTCDISGNLLLQRVSIQEVPAQIQVFPYQEELAKDLFTSQEIQEAKINYLYLQQNPDTPTANLPYPNAVMTPKSKWIIEKHDLYTDLETIQGVSVDVLAKIAQEAQV